MDEQTPEPKDIAALCEQAGVEHRDVQDPNADTFVLTFVGPRGAKAAKRPT